MACIDDGHDLQGLHPIYFSSAPKPAEIELVMDGAECGHRALAMHGRPIGLMHHDAS
jgi:hypothetical protein